jgi:FkbM family methyltransferase
VAGTLAARALRRMSHLLGVEDEDSVVAALHRARGRGVRVDSVVDVGAAQGLWTTDVGLRAFPQARALLLEAQDVHRGALEALAACDSRVRYVMAAAGDRQGITYFEANDPFGGVALSEPCEHNCIEVPMTTVDVCTRDAAMHGPFLLKLDTHGFELPILRGATEVLRQTALIVMEAYNFRLRDDESIRFWEMCAHMESIGFGCVDSCEQSRRPRDGVLWQMDLVFAPLGSEAFSSRAYE